MLYKIKAPVAITQMAWGIAFAEGVAYTENSELAKKLAIKGYEVTESPKAAENKDFSFSKMKKAELVAFANEHSVDVSGCKSNAEIITLLEENKSKENSQEPIAETGD